MAMEVVCGNCQGRLLVEQSGVIVACPHCGAHLQIGEPAAAVPSPEPPPLFQPPADAPEPSTTPLFPQLTPPAVSPPEAIAPPLFPTFQPPVFTPELEPDSEPLPEIILTPPPSPDVSTTAILPSSFERETGIFLRPTEVQPPLEDGDSWMPKIDPSLPQPTKPADAPPLPALTETSTILLPPSALPPVPPATDTSASSQAGSTGIWSRSDVENAVPDHSTMELIGAPPADPSAEFEGFNPEASVNPSSKPTVTPAEPNFTTNTPQLSPAPTDGAPATPAIVTSNASREAVVPRYLFVLAASYASAITLAFLYLWWRGNVSTIDLPDIVPSINKETGKVGLKLLRETPLPSAYRLRIGESRRYGSLLVTPVKVTKGPLEFTYFADDKQMKPPTQIPVLKLWVKFKNVSSDQKFPPLDEQLLYQRTTDKENAAQDRSNNYVCLQSERKRLGKRIPVYALPINGEWLIKNQNLNTPVEPQHEWETYIPSNDEDLSSLQGPLTWRLHFRKGYHPKSYRGVTTLVEVDFDSKDIQVES